MLARTPALAPVVHRAFADGLDLAYAVAAGFGLLAAVAVFILARPRPPGRESAGTAEASSAQTGQASGPGAVRA